MRDLLICVVIALGVMPLAFLLIILGGRLIGWLVEPFVANDPNCPCRGTGRPCLDCTAL